jgi:hypothetical protein
MRHVERPTSAVILAPFVKQSLGLGNARWVSVYEVDARMSNGKLCTQYLPNNYENPLCVGASYAGVKLVRVFTNVTCVIYWLEFVTSWQRPTILAPNNVIETSIILI